VKFVSYWSDPAWRTLRIMSFVTASITLIILGVVLAGASVWRGPLVGAVVANVVVMALLVRRTVVLRREREKGRR